MSVRMIVDDAALENGATLVGLVRPEEGLVLGLSHSGAAAPDPLRPIGTVGLPEGGEDGLDVETSRGARRLVLDSAIPVPDRVEVVRFHEELEARRNMPGMGRKLSECTVAMVGAGSVGSAIAVHLAQAGVGHLVVVDRDKMDAVNLSRHACDVHDVGREKAVAVANLVGRRFGIGEAVVADVIREQRRIEEVVAASDLVVATTDSPPAQLIINELCIERAVPAVYAAAYERACGGEVVAVRPGTPCLYCAVGFRARAVPDVRTEGRRMAYQAADANRLDAEPGLAVDIAHLVAVASAYALAILDPTGSRGALLEAGRSFVLLHGGSAPRGAFGELFRRPFDLLHVNVSRDDPCPVCGFKTNERGRQ